MARLQIDDRVVAERYRRFYSSGRSLARVRDAIVAKFPKATIKLTEEVVKVNDGKARLEYYEAIVDTADKKSFEVPVASDGKINKTEDKTEKKE